MGCVSSKLLKKNLKQELLFGNGDYPNHVVSLTSSTYGVLKLDQDQIHQLKKNNNSNKIEENAAKDESIAAKRSPPPKAEFLEVINAWELMGDLEDELPISNQVGSMKKVKKLVGKENRTGENHCINIGIDSKMGKLDHYSTPKGVLKSWNSSTNSTNKLRKSSSFDSPRRSNSGVPLRRKSLSPLFDPELIDSFEKELSQEKEQIKKMVSSKQSKSRTPKSRYSINQSSSSSILENFKEKCPPGGENCVVIYTTTLRGIRKTFEDCSNVRSIIQSYQIRLIERDISMDSGFKEELRKLMGTKEVKVPLVFVKGRLIGGAEEIVKLEEEEKLEGLFDGIPKSMATVCEGCGGIRFVMCMDCNGSCKILDEDQKKMVKCGECNENGLIQCPVCC